MPKRRDFLAMASSTFAIGAAEASDSGAIFIHVWWDRWNPVTKVEDVIHVSIGPVVYAAAEPMITDWLRHGLLIGVYAVPPNRIRLVENRLAPVRNEANAFAPGERRMPTE